MPDRSVCNTSDCFGRDTESVRVTAFKVVSTAFIKQKFARLHQLLSFDAIALNSGNTLDIHIDIIISASVEFVRCFYANRVNFELLNFLL